jgi:uncharacterized membrane protein YfcA
MLETIIFLLSIIHSIFGIGLLAIGTPLLLLLNYDFLIILKILLPCSILISTFQIYKTKNILKADKKIIHRSVPYVFLGALIIYFFSSNINFKLIIGFSILIVLFLKTFLKKKINLLINKNKTILISFTGFFHGLTNTGGSLISLIFQSLKKNKYEVQGCIAYTYFLYALIQYFLLNFFLKKLLINYDSVSLLVFTCAGYFLGNIIFKKIHFNFFLNILNLIVFFSAIYLIFSEFKIIFHLTL